MTIPAIALAASLLMQSAPAGSGAAPAWVWTLYEGDGPLVFANEVPDTPQLKATFDCAPGSGVVRVSVYGDGLVQGIATLTSGDSTAMTEATVGTDKISVPVRTDHPLFTQMMANGALKIAVGDAEQSVEVQPPFQTAMRRFGDLCGR